MDSDTSDPEEVSVYGAIALGVIVSMGLFLLDTAVVIRYLGITPHTSEYILMLEFSHLFRKSGQGPAEMVSNIAVFVPLGSFLAEYLAATKRFSPWRLVGRVVLAALAFRFPLSSSSWFCVWAFSS